MTVTARSVTSAFGWVALANYLNRFVGVIATLILAKALAPADFGLVAVASMIIEMLQIFKDMGLSEAVVYNKREDTRAIDTAHTILVGYNVLLFLLAAAAAPFAARSYQNPVVLPLILVMASSLVWDSLRAVPRSLCRKNLQYNRLIIPEVVPPFISSVVAVVMALTGFGVWSLVVKTVLHSLLGFVFLYKLIPYRPSFGFDREAARELFGYGRFIVGSTLVLVTLYNIDRFYLSRMAGIAALGVYELAIRLAELPVKQLSYLVGNVMFPIFSKMERDGNVLRGTFLKTLKYTATLTIPAAIGLSVYGPPFIWLLYGSRWQAAMLPLRILALYAGLRSVSSIIFDLMKATGRPNLLQQLAIFKLGVVALLGIPMIRWFGMPGLAVLILVAYAASLAFELRSLTTLLNATWGTLGQALLKPVAVAAVTIPGTYALSRQIGAVDAHIVALSTSMLTAGVLYLVAIYCLDDEVVADLAALRSSRRQPATLDGAVAP